MPNFDTSYLPNGSIQTMTSAPQVGAAVAGIGMDPHLQDVANQVITMKLAAAKRREQDDIEARARAYAEQRRQESMPVYHGGGAPAGAFGGSSFGGGAGTAEQQMQQVALQDARAKLAANTGPAPTRMVTGANIIPGSTLDVDAMNGYQRQAFLPNESRYQGKGFPERQ